MCKVVVLPTKHTIFDVLVAFASSDRQGPVYMEVGDPSE